MLIIHLRRPCRKTSEESSPRASGASRSVAISCASARPFTSLLRFPWSIPDSFTIADWERAAIHGTDRFRPLPDRTTGCSERSHPAPPPDRTSPATGSVGGILTSAGQGASGPYRCHSRSIDSPAMPAKTIWVPHPGGGTRHGVGTPRHRAGRLRHRRRRRRPAPARTADRLAARAGRPLALRRVVVRDPHKPRAADAPPRPDHHRPARRARTTRRSTSSSSWSAAPTGPGRSCSTPSRPASTSSPPTRRCWPSTAPEVFEAARQARAGGRLRGQRRRRRADHPRPWPRAWPPTRSPPSRASSTAPRTSSSPAMTERGASYADALAEAQRLGYAEADPTLDVDGTDAAHKLAILAQIAFGVAARPTDIERHGIDRVDAMDIRFADELGYTIKLLAEAWAGRQRRWPCTSPRCCCGTRTCWPRCAGRTTRCRWSATRSARRSTRGRAPGRCRPPAPSSPT